nr:retinal guanylyl cyclase 2 [Hymenolepis microstoma]
MINKYGGTYSNLARECIKELNAECEKFEAEQSQLNVEATTFPQLRSTADCCSVKEHMKDWCNDYLGKRSVDCDIKGPLDPPTTGYGGYIPKAAAANLDCGHTFHDGAKKCLSTFRTENLNHFARLKTPVDPSSINSKDIGKQENDTNEDPCNSRIFRKSGMIPHYTGHIHGQISDFGKTVGESSRNLEADLTYNESFSVFLGPPLVNDCDMVSQWMTVGEPKLSHIQQLYLISFTCPVLDFASFYIDQVKDSENATVHNTIAGTSAVVQRKTFLTGLIVYLLNSGWKRIALLYEFGTNQDDIPEMFDTISVTLNVYRTDQVFEIVKTQSIWPSMNFTELFYPIQDQLDAVLLFVQPLLATKFLLAIQNLSRILQGRIAIMYTNPTDMYTYDSLHAWKSLLANSDPVMASGLSLIIQTALPRGTTYDSESSLYNEDINLSIAHSAALAVQLVHLNLNPITGSIYPNSGLFEPLQDLDELHVPTLPNITFFYKTGGGHDLRGIFDLFYFTIKSNATLKNYLDISNARFSDVFELIAILRYPLILPQKRGNIQWLGDGKGPLHTHCLVADCGINTDRFSDICPWMFSSIYHILMLRIHMSKLVYLEDDLEYKAIEEETIPAWHNSPIGSSRVSLQMSPQLKVRSPLHALTSPKVPSLGSLNWRTKPRESRAGNIAWLNGVPMYVKSLNISCVLLHSKLFEYLAGLREMRHENINPFMGCYMTPCSFSLMFEYCSRGCLQGMEYLHNSNLGVHGRLKSSNCVISGRWALRITDFGIPRVFTLNGIRPPEIIEEKLWTAPELLRNNDATLYGTKPGDVYSFAIVMHEVFYQCKPYGPSPFFPEEIIERVIKVEDPPFRPTLLEQGISVEYRNILERSWLENPCLRPTFKELDGQIESLSKGRKTNIVDHMFKTMEVYSTKLELQVQARIEELENEKRTNELLISRMLPSVVAEALKSGIAVAPETYEEVSIFLSDIVGFTTISAMSTPLQVVDLLNDLYTLFDKTISNYDVYKVETIGDAYMVASGLPVRNGIKHAGEVALAALDLLSECGTFTIKHLPDIPLRLRIGLHSGPCVAGVVGLVMPRYCLFGDTVIRALKMESSGAAFRIHISQQIKDVLDKIGGYHFEYRGPIEFDGGVKTTTYWLTSCDEFHKPLPEPPPLIASIHVESQDEDESRIFLFLYYFTSGLTCLPEIHLYNFSKSIASAVKYVRSLIPITDTTFFYANLNYRFIHGCSLMESKRGSMIVQLLQELERNAVNAEGFTVLLGPPLPSDCDLVSKWISLGEPNRIQSSQVYQISYYCPVLGYATAFVEHLLDSPSDSLEPTLAAVSMLVQLKTILQSVLVYLIHKGWSQIVLFYESNIVKTDITTIFESISLPLDITQSHKWAINIVKSEEVRTGQPFANILTSYGSKIDAVVLLMTPSLAMEILIEVQNLPRIKQGRIALIHANPSDTLTYDALIFWRHFIKESPPTLSAGQSLILLTALPLGTEYDAQSILYEQTINLAVASAAALATRLVQMNLELGGGNISSEDGLFTPMALHGSIEVPTLPNITFLYKMVDGLGMEGFFDMFLFTLTPNATKKTGVELQGNYDDIFRPIDVIRYPLMLPHQQNKMNWPGDGNGPRSTFRLASPCDLSSVRTILEFNLAGNVITLLIYLLIVFGYRRLERNFKKINSLELIFCESDFVYKGREEDEISTRYNSRRSSLFELNLNAHVQIPMSATRFSVTNLSNAEDVFRSMNKKEMAFLNGDAVFIKRLTISHVIVRSKLAAYLADLREIRHENINIFLGCYMTDNAFNLVQDYCPRGSLKDVVHSKSIIFDWEFKLSLMNDFIKGMEYLHSTLIKAHGRLKSTNCVINSRWVLKITDFGIQNIYTLTNSCSPVKLEDKLWMAPELLRDESAAILGTRAGDVYSFAIIMHKVFFRTKPYGPERHSTEEIVERVAAMEKPAFRPKVFGEEIPTSYIEILEQCWHENPSVRPTFNELRERMQYLTRGKKTDIVEHMFKMMEQYSTGLEDKVEARMEELENERKKKEILIGRMLPPVVAEALKSGIAVAPETYDEVSIYFSDIVGFTTISAMSTPMQVVDLLNDLYTLFDQTIANYDVYKVETIGDAYMVTSGLPVRNGRRHAGEVAMTALDLLSACGTFTIKHLPEVPLRLRIGLHCGPCVAGVVGLTMPRYCLFGGTVNQAQKMESSGAAFRIHISQQIKEILDEIGGYRIQYRGPIEFDGGFKTFSHWLINCDNFHKPLPEPVPLVE